MFRLAVKPFLDRVERGCSSRFGDRSRQRNFFGTHCDTVLRIATLLYPSGSRQSVKSFASLHLARRVCVEEYRLANGVWADEALVVRRRFSLFELFFGFVFLLLQLDLRILRTCFQAASAAHALAERVIVFLFRSPLSRTRT